MSDSTNCIHKFKNQKIKKELNYCRNCGVVKYNKIISVKPKNLEKKTDIDPFEVFNKIAENKKKILIDYKNPIHKQYLNRRKNLLEILKNFSMLQNFDDESFFQTIYYLDKCILKESFTQYLIKDNKTAEFLRLFSKDKILNFDRLFLAIVLGCFSLSSNF